MCSLAILAATAACSASDGPSQDQQGADTDVISVTPISGPDPSSDPATEAAVPIAMPEVVGEVQIHDHQITFHRVVIVGENGEEPSVMMHELGVLGSPDPVGNLLEFNGPLTMLEIFNAFAGPDQTADEALVTSHALEAELLGRPDASVTSALIPKTSLGAPPVASCSNYVYPDLNPFRWISKHSLISNELERNAFICAGDPIEAYVNVRSASQQCARKTKNWVTAAVCNDGFGWSCSGGIIGQSGYGPSTAGTWAMYPPVSLANGSYQRWVWGPTNSAKGMSAIGVPNSASSRPCTMYHVLSGMAAQ
ncbi:MAG TPA: hypothetical protein VGK73_10625 [Polyangiaceae bacterium]